MADNIATGEVFTAGAGHNAAIDIALEGIAILARMDAAREAAGVEYWTPDIGLTA